MDPSLDIPDSTDWLNTPLKQFSELENALHCEICKEFYDTPMITSCAHTFCSKCIRTSLSADGKCPACRTADQASKLRNNWALQTVVATFLAARPEALSVARKEQELATKALRPAKRKRAVADTDGIDQSAIGSRTTRSKSRRVAASQTSQPETVEIDDTDDDGDFAPEQPDDGLVECPLGCGKRMQIAQVEPHLDRCDDEKKEADRPKQRAQEHKFGGRRTSPSRNARPQERLAELNYSLLRDQAMRKKLEELGIPGWGAKQLMVKRHIEWVNLWNANCDSARPRTKRELLSDLDTWERTQGGRAPNNHSTTANSIMRKDFDGPGWANRNKDDFSRLIADARRKKGNPATASEPEKVDDITEDPGKPALNGDEGSSPHFRNGSSQTLPNQPRTETSQPYAEHPEALLSVREKVEAVNAGRHIEPVMNEGFRTNSQGPSLAASLLNGVPKEESNSGYLSPSEPAPAAQNQALLEHSHFGQTRKSSQDEHTANYKTGQACDLPAHLQSSPRKVPMFTVPQEPLNDLDGTGDGTSVQ